jgi:glycosyltransferase involved in cell wall biosynthesis
MPEPRVLHVVATAQLRGAETFAGDLVGALNRLGVPQRVAVLRRTPGPAARFDAPTTVLPAGWRAPGVRIDVRTSRALGGLIRRARPDVVLAHGGEPFKYAALLPGVPPIVYRKIGLAAPWITSAMSRWAHGRLMRRAARVVAVGEEIRRELVEDFGLPAGRVVTIPTGRDRRTFEAAGADGERATARRSLGIPQGTEVIVSLLALTPEKDPVGHVDVVRDVGERHPDAVYLVAGDGPLRGAVESAVQRNGLHDRVRLLGSTASVPTLLAAADVHLLASRSEGIPSSLIEAGMAGIPSAAYDVGGVAEVVVDGETGLLAPPGHRPLLADHVGRLLADPAGRRAMGRAARRRCTDRFDIASIAGSFLTVLRSVAGRASRG